MIDSINIINFGRKKFPLILHIEVKTVPSNMWRNGNIHIGKILYDEDSYKFPVQHSGINNFDTKGIDNYSYKKVISYIVSKLININTKFDCTFNCYNDEIFEYIKQFETLL